MRSGGRPPSLAAICAPIASSGAMIRAMGRRDNDSSPTSSLLNPCPASMPLSMRMVDPELPQSRGSVRLLELAPASANQNGVFGSFQLHSQSGETTQRAGAIRTGRKILPAASFPRQWQPTWRIGERWICPPAAAGLPQCSGPAEPRPWNLWSLSTSCLSNIAEKRQHDCDSKGEDQDSKRVDRKFLN